MRKIIDLLAVAFCLQFGLMLTVFDRASAAETMTLERLLDMATQSSPHAKSWELERRAAESALRASDLALSPRITADAALSRDRRETLGRSSTADVGTVGYVESSVDIPFATGTTLSLNATHERISREDLNGNQNAAGWEARLSQSLLRDGFGSATKLRRDGAQLELETKRLSLLQERQKLLSDIESSYWDLIVAQKQRSIYRKNLERRTALEKWTQRRIDQFAAERQDLLQVQTVLSQLQLGLAGVDNDITTALSRLRILIPGSDPATWVFDEKVLEIKRDERSLVALASNVEAAGSATPVRIDALLAQLTAREAKTSSLAVEDSLKPELSPYVSYGANGVEPGPANAWGRASQAKSNVARIGVSLAMDLDAGLKNDRATAARLLAESRAVKADALAKESDMAWAELVRRLRFLETQVTAARKLADLQMRKVLTERNRFEQGRTTTLQMTAFEVDAADSELKVYVLLAELRKTETLARNFVLMSGGRP